MEPYGQHHYQLIIVRQPVVGGDLLGSLYHLLCMGKVVIDQYRVRVLIEELGHIRLRSSDH